MDLLELFVQVGIALGLGLLVGLQRETTSAEIAGIRTIPLITLWGTIAGWLSLRFGGWVLGASILALAALIVVGNLYLLRRGDADGGVTSEAALFVMFGVGALLVFAPKPLAVAIGGGVAVLLHAKAWMHGIAGRMERADVTALMRFALIALVILPVLPNRDFGPFAVLNLREIWLMVVLIVGISFGGYVLYRVFGARAGTLLGGILGGIISSTATTVSYARRTGDRGELARLSAVVVMIANTVVMVRVFIEIALVGPALLPHAAYPVGAMLIVQALLAAGLWWHVRHEEASLPKQENPTELRPALLFAGIYAVVLVAVAAAKRYLGEQGLYAVALVSGLTDVDAVTLSTARMAQTQQLDPELAWRLILVATMSNLAFKSAIVGVLANRRMFTLVACLSAVAIAVGVVLVVT